MGMSSTVHPVVQSRFSYTLRSRRLEGFGVISSSADVGTAASTVFNPLSYTIMSQTDNPTTIDLDDLEFEFTLKNHPDATLEPFVILFSGYVRGWDENAGEDRNLGNIVGSRINLKAARAQAFDQQELLEQLSAEIADFSETVLGDDSVLAELYPDMQCIVERNCNYSMSRK
jgi:hypothetical protein